MRIRNSAVVLGLAALLLAGCGGGGGQEAVEKRPERPQEMRHLVLTLAGYEGPESAGLLMAKKRGYFAEVGLNVEVLVPSNAVSAIGYVSGEVDDLGLSPQPQVVMAREEGEPIIAVGSLISQPTATMIWLKGSKIRGIADLRGKTIAIPSLPFQRGLLESLLSQAGLTPEDVRIKEVGYELVSSLASGRADAIFGGSENVEGAELEARGLDPVSTPVSDLGLPAYEELVWIARTDFAAKNQQLIRGFMSALRRGTAAALEDPEAAAQAIESGDETNPEATGKGTEAGVEATLPLLSKTGQMSPRRASRLIDWMHDQGMIRRKLPTSALLTNRYVP